MKTYNKTSHWLSSVANYISPIAKTTGLWAGGVIWLTVTAAAQNIFVADSGSGNIYEFTPGGAPSTFASGLNTPDALVFDAVGNLYVGEGGGNPSHIYKFTPAGEKTVFAASTNSNISYLPDTVGMVFDRVGDMFVGEGGNSSGIYEIFTNGTESYFFDTGDGPYGLVFDGAGDLFAPVQTYIYEYTTGVAANEFIFDYNLNGPQGVAFDSIGDLYVADQYNGNILEYTNGIVSQKGIFASGLSGPAGLAFDSVGNLYVTTLGNNKIYEFTNGVAGAIGVFASGLNSPYAIAIAPTPAFSVNISTFAGVIISNGQIGSNYLIQATSNLNNSNWTTLTNLALPSNPYIYIDYTSPTNRQQFYRAVPQ